MAIHISYKNSTLLSRKRSYRKLINLIYVSLMGSRNLLHEHPMVHRCDSLLEQKQLAQKQSQDGTRLEEYMYDPRKESLCQGLDVDFYRAGAANSS
jgi:hypothetical protein